MIATSAEARIEVDTNVKGIDTCDKEPVKGDLNAAVGFFWILGLAAAWMGVLYVFNYLGNKVLGR